MHHDLKIEPPYFRAVVADDKTLELRTEQDRVFTAQDTMTLHEYDPEIQATTGATHTVRITHVLRDPEHRWLQPEVVALSIRPVGFDDGAAYASMLHDATERLTTAIAPERVTTDPTFVAWPQTWATSACGFNEVGGDVLMTRPTFVWRIIGHPVHVIYHNYRWAYTVLRPNTRFYASVSTWRLPGASETAAIAELESCL